MRQERLRQEVIAAEGTISRQKVKRRMLELSTWNWGSLLFIKIKYGLQSQFFSYHWLIYGSKKPTNSTHFLICNFKMVMLISRHFILIFSASRATYAPLLYVCTSVHSNVISITTPHTQFLSQNHCCEKAKCHNFWLWNHSFLCQKKRKGFVIKITNLYGKN